MSASILSAISHLPQLRGSLRHTAQRLAYFADGTGKARKSYSFLAKDMHVSERTVKRHVARLQAMCIITKDTLRLTLTRYATNVYTFIIGVDHLHKRTGDRVLPEEAKREKSSRAREEEHPNARNPVFLRTRLDLKEGSVIWQAVVALR